MKLAYEVPLRHGRPRRPDIAGVGWIRPLYPLSELSVRHGVRDNSNNRDNRPFQHLIVERSSVPGYNNVAARHQTRNNRHSPHHRLMPVDRASWLLRTERLGMCDGRISNGTEIAREKCQPSAIFSAAPKTRKLRSAKPYSRGVARRYLVKSAN